MDLHEKAHRLKAMLTKIAPGRDLLEIPRPAPPRSFLEGLGATMEVEPTVDSGLQKLAEDRVHEITPNEMFVLEAIVMPQNRPVIFVRGDSYDDIGEPWLGLNATETKNRIARLLPSIGRIEVPLLPQYPYGGTGFVVGEGLLMTNRHVAQLFSQGLGLDIRYQAGGSAVDFKQQIDTAADDQSRYFKVREVVMIHPFWDMAILQVDGLPSDHVLPLSVTAPEELFGRNIVAVGYPALDVRNDVPLQNRIFGGKYNVKRLQPGTIRNRDRIPSFEHMVNAMTHDASTLGGNSGSAIIDVDSGEVVALHFAGEYLKANYAVPMFELARDRRVAPQLNFKGKLPAPTTDWDDAWQATVGAERSSPQPAPVALQPSTPGPQLQSPLAVPPATTVGIAAATWTIPIHITISVGQPLAAAGQAQVSGAEAEAVIVDQNYSNRAGYNPDFLESITVPLPRLTKDMEKDTAQVRLDVRKHDDPFELTYYHYSVYLNKRRRTAWFSAANVDGDHRPDIGKRQGDRWYADPRILKSEQLGQEAFESGIDRGHLTRREDTAWGDDVPTATLANNDTFHFTNCSLQASAFNRGKDRWQGLEQYLLEQHAKKSKRRMVVITGPLFASKDPTYKNDRMNYTVRCPLQFWKVCVLVRNDGTPSATAFILGQEEIEGLPGFEEAFNVAATQITIAKLEKETGLDFGDLRNQDHFAQAGSGTLEGTTEATVGGRVICRLADIVV